MFLFKVWPSSSVASDCPDSPPCSDLAAGERAQYFWHGADILQGTFGWSDRAVWELLRVRRVLQEHRGVSALRARRSWNVMQKEKRSLVDTFLPWEHNRRLRREGNQAAYHEVERTVTFYSSRTSPPQCLYSFHVVLSEFFARVYYRVLPDRKQTAILWPTSWVLQPSLSCATWGIYSVTHHWESRELPLYSKHCATIIMRNWDKWQAFLPTKCYNPATSNDTSGINHHAVCSAGSTLLLLLLQWSWG